MKFNQGASRREFLQVGATVSVAGVVAGFAGIDNAHCRQDDASPLKKSDEGEQVSGQKRYRIGAIGTGGRWSAIGLQAMEFGDIVAVCDESADQLASARKLISQHSTTVPRCYEHYEPLLRHDGIDAVTIVAAESQRARIAIAAMQAGKDVYCEAPFALTIDEGQQIIAALEETGRVFQVDTPQRSEYGLRFLTAVAVCRQGRLGAIRKVKCEVGADIEASCVHDIDIAMWALGKSDTGPVRIAHKGLQSEPSPSIVCEFSDGMLLEISNSGKRGLVIEGDAGHLRVGQQTLAGEPIEALASDPLDPAVLVTLYKGKQPGGKNGHMRNFFECVATREQPISDVYSHLRAMTTCRLASRVAGSGQEIQWDPESQMIRSEFGTEKGARE